MLSIKTEEEFQEQVLSAAELVLVDFAAPWCGPCRMLVPVLEEISEENPDVHIITINVDEAEELSEIYEVRNLPTLLVFKRGESVFRQVGTATKTEIEAWLADARA
ncbi:thioredoxin [Alphaproteobacteria bacterium]|nr:thioredoxin [Alphaproteobacteria bacterium]GHS99641.1 thioredoxin [Alphaproteobacteria bacterium]